ncbi:MAG: DUF3368 domain-containing protein [Cyclobacteriaceae bacterium]|nr:DUF3368 domain-containing protein [Cyclobacteriaceae bacterium]
MREILIVDTSCLILLFKIGAFDILKNLYSEVLTTPQVFNEYNHTLPDFVQVKEVNDTFLQQALEQNLGKGESSVIALGFTLPECSLVIDDRKARKAARSMGFTVTGTLGVLVKAKQEGIIGRIKPLLDKLLETDFRVSDEVITKILEIAGEN